MLTGVELLRESIKALLFENFSEHNTIQLTKAIREYNEREPELQGLKEESIANELIEKIPQLRKHRIDYLQSGTEGAAFEMDNGHILKIVFNPHPFRKKQEKSYTTMQQTLHKGTGRRSDIMVYDVGNTGKPFNFSYIEMEKVKTFFEWSRSDPMAKGMYDIVSAMSEEIMKWEKGPLYSQPKKMDDAIWKLVQAARGENLKMTALKSKQKGIINSLAATLARHFLEGRPLDIHAGNIGVIERGGKPPVFTLFDF